MKSQADYPILTKTEAGAVAHHADTWGAIRARVHCVVFVGWTRGPESVDWLIDVKEREPGFETFAQAIVNHASRERLLLHW